MTGNRGKRKKEFEPKENVETVVYLRTAAAIGALILVAVLLISTIVMAVTSIGLKSKVNALEEDIATASELLGEGNPLLEYNFEGMPYQEQFQSLYVEPPKEQLVRDKTVFLTFEDGPSERTSEILDILKAEDVKATFFVVGNESENAKAIMKRIVDEGHKIAVHSYSHDYENVYSSVDAYLDDFNKIYNLIYEATGVNADIFRFPGGSINSYNITNNVEISAEMLRRGFVYYDWNVSSGDAGQNADAESIISFATSSEENRIMLLLHDSESKKYTVEALPEVIAHYKNSGYSFSALQNSDTPIALNAR